MAAIHHSIKVIQNDAIAAHHTQVVVVIQAKHAVITGVKKTVIANSSIMKQYLLLQVVQNPVVL